MKMYSYTQVEPNKNRIDAVLRVENLNAKDCNSKSIENEKARKKNGERIYYNSISVLKPIIKASQQDLIDQIASKITNEIPFLRREAQIEYKEKNSNEQVIFFNLKLYNMIVYVISL
jgi:hypothetical protein